MTIEFPVFGTPIEAEYDSDPIDRLRYFRTPVFLVIAGIFIMTKQYVGQSVQCWAPTQFKGGWEKYAETYCLIENTYFVPMNESNLPEVDTRENREMKYYQWVPFILFGLAFTLYIPRLFWQVAQRVTGIRLSSMLVHLRRQAMNGLKTYLDVEQDLRREKRKQSEENQKSENIMWGNHLTIALVGTKLLATIVIVCSIIFLEYFMGLGQMYGYTVVRDILAGREWKQSGSFPRVTFCDFEVREIGYINNWTLQCVLMVNMFNEKLFVALWWWYYLLAIMSIFDIFRIIYRFTAYHQINFVADILNVGKNKFIEKTQISRFIRSTLKNDGISLLHIIYSNSTIFETFEYLEPIWISANSPNKHE